MPETHIAQLNIGRFRFPTDDPRMAGFMDNLDRVNALAERSPGFVWRMQDESGNATSEDMLDRSRGAGNETSSETAGVDNQQEWYDSEGNTVGVMWDDEGMMTFEANEGEYADNAGSYRSRGAGDMTSAEVSGDDNMQEAD